jgi:HSP20 family protein
MVSQTMTQAVDEQNAFLELPRELNGPGRAALLLDAYEADNVVELTAEVPGVREGDMELHLEGDKLTISVDKRGRSEGKKLHFAERSYGRFHRSIKLPFSPDPSSVTAQLENGVLVLRFPRVESSRTHRIPLARTQGQAEQERSAIGNTWDGKSADQEPLDLTNVTTPTPPSGVPRRPPAPSGVK